MNKKLTTKVQKLIPQLAEKTTVLGGCFVLEPETRDIILKKGVLYCVFNVKTEAEFDTIFAINIVSDVLREKYFQSTGTSPIQSLEKSVSEVKNKLTQLLAQNSVQELNIIAGVLWGSVFYIVKMGQGEVLLAREGDLRAVNMLTEGSFSSASGIVKENDTVIFATTEFVNSFPPQRLVSSLISEKDLKEGESCLLIKMAIDKSLSEDEVVDFGLRTPESSRSTKPNSFKSKVSTISTNMIRSLKNVRDRITSLKRPKPVSTSRITGNVNTISTDVITPKLPNIKEKAALSALKKMKFEKWMLVPIVAFVLGSSVFYSIYTRGEETIEETLNNPTPQQVEQPAEEPVTTPEPDPTALYDLKIVDQAIDPNSIEVVGTKLYVSTTGGKLLTSEIDSISFREVETQYQGINNLTSMGSRLLFSDASGFKVMNATNNQIISTVNAPNIRLLSTYNEFIYTITGDQVTRYTLSGDTYAPSTWGTDPKFQSAASIGISYSIYVLGGEGDVTTFTGGEEDSFTADIPGTLAQPAEIIATQPLDNVYIADKGNDRVIVLDKEGNLVKEVKPAKPGTWLDTRGIAVSTDESTLYVLSGTRLYEMDL